MLNIVLIIVGLLFIIYGVMNMFRRDTLIDMLSVLFSLVIGTCLIGIAINGIHIRITGINLW